ncbi:MAG: DUF1918 domain-containing protein [Solirubrobacteraceae bacterium]
MAFAVGKRVVAESESIARRPRSGVVEEVLRGDPSPRCRIRWDDGHQSIYTPASGVLRAEPRVQRHRPAAPQKREPRLRCNGRRRLARRQTPQAARDRHGHPRGRRRCEAGASQGSGAAHPAPPGRGRRRGRSVSVSASSGDDRGPEATPAVVQICNADRLHAGPRAGIATAADVRCG